MEIWLDLRDGGEPPEWCDGFDYVYHGKADGGRKIGAQVVIDSEEGQSAAIAAIGSVEWLLIECRDWEMIPVENIVAASNSAPTMVVASVSRPESIQGIAFALDNGVDALLITPERELWEAAVIARAQRMERGEEEIIEENSGSQMILNKCELTNVESFGTGDRICVDVTRLLELGQGMLVGSQAGQLALVHAETIESEYVPIRPFRVNAGAVHSYILLSDGSTKYLSELSSGDEVMLVSSEGVTSSARIGRIKMEHRPLIRISWFDESGTAGQVVLQQAETVRLLNRDGRAISITNLKIGDEILAFSLSKTRHLGKEVNIFSDEY